MSPPPRIVGWGPRAVGLPRPSVADEVGMHKPGPGDYLRQLGAKTIDEMVAKFDHCTPRQGVEL